MNLCNKNLLIKSRVNDDCKKKITFFIVEYLKSTIVTF